MVYCLVVNVNVNQYIKYFQYLNWKMNFINEMLIRT